MSRANPDRVFNGICTAVSRVPDLILRGQWLGHTYSADRKWRRSRGCARRRSAWLQGLRASRRRRLRQLQPEFSTEGGKLGLGDIPGQEVASGMQHFRPTSPRSMPLGPPVAASAPRSATASPPRRNSSIPATASATSSTRASRSRRRAAARSPSTSGCSPPRNTSAARRHHELRQRVHAAGPAGGPSGTAGRVGEGQDGAGGGRAVQAVAGVGDGWRVSRRGAGVDQLGASVCSVQAGV